MKRHTLASVCAVGFSVIAQADMRIPPCSDEDPSACVQVSSEVADRFKKAKDARELNSILDQALSLARIAMSRYQGTDAPMLNATQVAQAEACLAAFSRKPSGELKKNGDPGAVSGCIGGLTSFPVGAKQSLGLYAQGLGIASLATSLCSANIPEKRGCLSSQEMGQKILATLQPEPALPSDSGAPLPGVGAKPNDSISIVQTRLEAEQIGKEINLLWLQFASKNEEEKCESKFDVLTQRRANGKWRPTWGKLSPALQASLLVESINHFSDPEMKFLAKNCLQSSGLKELLGQEMDCHMRFLKSGAEVALSALQKKDSQRIWREVQGKQKVCLDRALRQRERISQRTGEFSGEMEPTKKYTGTTLRHNSEGVVGVEIKREVEAKAGSAK